MNEIHIGPCPFCGEEHWPRPEEIIKHYGIPKRILDLPRKNVTATEFRILQRQSSPPPVAPPTDKVTNDE